MTSTPPPHRSLLLFPIGRCHLSHSSPPSKSNHLHRLPSLVRHQSPRSSTADLPHRPLLSPSEPPISPIPLLVDLLAPNISAITTALINLIKYHRIWTSTRDFSRSNFIGEGGFWRVYKGFIDGDLRPGLKAQAVAVKRLDLQGTQGHNEWLAEVIFLGQLQHQRLLKLIGYCYEDEHRLLVYEFMAQGSLENHLFKSLASLLWLTRLKIAVGAAKGLAFLHEAEKLVLYRDFKASNILLDSDSIEDKDEDLEGV